MSPLVTYIFLDLEVLDAYLQPVPYTQAGLNGDDRSTMMTLLFSGFSLSL